MSDLPDELDALLAPPPAGPRESELREAIFRRTGRVFTRRKWLRRGQLVASALVLFAGGVFAGWFARPTALPVREFVAVPVPIPIALPPVESAPPANEYVSAEEYELKAEQAPADEAAQLYRLAGSRFEQQYDFAQASRCYRLYLLAVAPKERAVATDDSWLLISVKTSQRQEYERDAKQDP